MRLIRVSQNSGDSLDSRTKKPRRCPHEDKSRYLSNLKRCYERRVTTGSYLLIFWKTHWHNGIILHWSWTSQVILLNLKTFQAVFMASKYCQVLLRLFEPSRVEIHPQVSSSDTFSFSLPSIDTFYSLPFSSETCSNLSFRSLQVLVSSSDTYLYLSFSIFKWH